MINEEPVQQVLDQATVTLEFYDLDGKGPQSVIEAFIRAFDLSVAPLMRAGLVQVAPNEHLLMVDMHHIITDGVSQSILIKDFMAIYNNEQLPDIKLSYKDYATWTQTEEQQKATAQQREFWINELGDKNERLNCLQTL